MRIFTYTILAMVFSLSGCSSQKKLVDNPPFELGQATCQAWKGGRAETGSGMLLEIPVLSENLDNIKIQQAYFRGMLADVAVTSNQGNWVAKANFTNNNAGKPDMVMHEDATKEVGNQPPSKQVKFPFELGSDECVISYMDGDTVKYFKIEGIKETKARIYQ